MRAGELPLELIRMKAKGCEVKLNSNQPGFTLPSNIGELGDDITELDLSGCSLRGASRVESLQHKFAHGIARAGELPKIMPPSLEILNLYEAGKFTGGIPAEWGSLTNLKDLTMVACGLDGVFVLSHVNTKPLRENIRACR